MKNLLKTAFLLLALFLNAFAQTTAPPPPTDDDPEPIPGEYIVLLKETVAVPTIMQQTTPNEDRVAGAANSQRATEANLAIVRAVAARNGIPTTAIQEEFADVIVGFSATLSPDQVARLQADPSVEVVEPDHFVGLGALEFYENPCTESEAMMAQSTPCAVTKAGGPANGSGKSTWIWILDTGIDLDHPDLNVQTNGTYAKSFVSGESVNDGHGHGTHVAGIAAAKNNSVGSVGVSAGATVVPVKVLNNSEGKGKQSKIIKGLDHVAKNYLRNDVVNMSLGSHGWKDCKNKKKSYRKAIENLTAKEVHVVMSAGNEGSCSINSLPACYNGTRIYTVGAILCNNNCSGYNWGSNVDWVAVGVDVYSTYKGGGYGTMSGTSMATPVVSGIIHARAGAPLSAGNVTCGNGCAANLSYKIAKR